MSPSSKSTVGEDVGPGRGDLRIMLQYKPLRKTQYAPSQPLPSQILGIGMLCEVANSHRFPRHEAVAVVMRPFVL
jgi:hypothetical protein